jgi:hypothetical protein
MSKRRCTAFDTLLTFCPPAPWARIAVISTSSGETLRWGRIEDPPAAQAAPAARPPARLARGLFPARRLDDLHHLVDIGGPASTAKTPVSTLSGCSLPDSYSAQISLP